MGGSHSELLRTLAITAVLGFGSFGFVLCMTSSGRICQGSVLNAALRRVFPGVGETFAASFGWFWLGESIESGHGLVPTSSILIALLATSAVLGLFVRLSLRALARIVFAASSGDFKTRSYDRVSIAEQIAATPPVTHVLRLFSRPPPSQHSY